jgi:hypothetical protein
VRYVRRALNLAFLAPKIVEAIAAGNYRIWRPGLVGGAGWIRTPGYRTVRPFFLRKEVDQHVPPCRRGSDSISSRADEIIGWRFSDTCFKILCHCE